MDNKNKKIGTRILIMGSVFYSLIFIALAIVFVSIKLNKKPIEPTNPYVKEGVHFYSKDYILDYRLGNPKGTVDVLSPNISYRIDIEKDTYDYNEEFIIRYRITFFDPEIDPGDLKIKFISDNFEFLSPTEYIFKDCQPIYQNNHDTPIDIKLRVKALKKTFTIDSILILLDFNISEVFKDELRRRQHEDEEKGLYFNYYDDCYNYYNNDFQMMQFLYHINDELGTILIDETRKENFPDPIENYPNRKVAVEAFDLAIYESLNRLYEKNLITKKEYIDRIYGSASGNAPMVILEPYYEENKRTFIYISNHFRAYFSVNKELIPYGISAKEYAKYLIMILHEEEKITKEEYDNEIKQIETKSVKLNYRSFDFPSKVFINYYLYSFLIPFDDYQLFCLDYIISK